LGQVAYINARIRAARAGEPLHGVSYVEDPSDKLIEVNLAALKWNMQQRRFGLTGEGLERLHEMSVELLEMLKSNIPEKTGEKSGWKIEKAHSILHKVSLSYVICHHIHLYYMLCNV
jgi:hypothetical protein